MPKFQLKVGAVEAIQYLHDENISAVQYFFEQNGDNGKKLKYDPDRNGYVVLVKNPYTGRDHQTTPLEKGEYIVRHLDGSYSVFTEEAFLMAYERVRE